MKLCEKTTDFRVNLCCFSTVGISGLQPHAQLRSIYILRLCMRLFCPHTFLMPHVYRHNRERPTSIYSSKYRCSAVIIIVLYGSITLSGGIPRSTAQKRINKKASPPKQIPIQRVKAPRGCFFISARSAPTYAVKYFVPTQVAPTRSPFIRRAG